MTNHSSLSFSRYRSRCHLVAAFVCVLFGGIQYFASMARTSEVRAELDANLNHRQSLVGQSEALLQRLASLQSEENLLGEELRSLREKIPYKADDHAFLESLAHLAEHAGLEILEFQPGRAQTDQKFEKVPVKISAVCNWPQLCQFLHKVNESSRLCSIDEFRVATTDDTTEQLHVNLSIGIFSSYPKMMAQSEKGTLE